MNDCGEQFFLHVMANSFLELISSVINCLVHNLKPAIFID